MDSVTASCDTLRRRTKALSASCDNLRERNERLVDNLKTAQKTNLIYRQRIESSTDELQNKESIISGLKKELRKTVTASSRIESESSNLDEDNKRLRSELHACKNVLRSYQSAYVSIYASALGVNPDSISFSDTTSVSELQKAISGAANTANIPSTVMVEPFYADDMDDDAIISL
ncbi:MAG: hypothetical protein NC235_12880 [Clostridiales bacterium]|nr:hypothetical protein [Clostridiales bacterium]